MADRNGGGGFSRIAAEWAQVISALVGAAAAAVALMATNDSVRVGNRQSEDAKTLQTLQFFATFNGEAMLTIRHEISNEDWCVRYEYDKDPADRLSYRSNLSNEEIYMVVDFFDALDNSCTQNLCNQQFTAALFRAYSQDMYEKLSKFVIEARSSRRDNTFGAGMAHMAQDDRTPIQEVADRYRREECEVPAGGARPQPSVSPSQPG